MKEETEQQKAQRLKNLEHVRSAYGILTGHRSLARARFNRLKRGQKKLLLIASGIYTDDFKLSKQFESLTDLEVEKLEVGFKRLKSLVNDYSGLNASDFAPRKQSKQKAA